MAIKKSSPKKKAQLDHFCEASLNTNPGDLLDDVFAMMKAISAESDRGSSLLAASYLDEGLKKLLLAFMIEDGTSAKLMKGETSPLSTFSAKISTCFALGLISRNSHHNLTLIRRIRNDFAHEIAADSFNIESLSDRCKGLMVYGGSPPGSSPRAIFNLAVLSVLAEVHCQTFLVERIQVAENIPENRELVEFTRSQADSTMGQAEELRLAAFKEMALKIIPRELP